MTDNDETGSSPKRAPLTGMPGFRPYSASPEPTAPDKQAPTLILGKGGQLDSAEIAEIVDHPLNQASTYPATSHPLLLDPGEFDSMAMGSEAVGVIKTAETMISLTKAANALNTTDPAVLRLFLPPPPGQSRSSAVHHVYAGLEAMRVAGMLLHAFAGEGDYPGEGRVMMAIAELDMATRGLQSRELMKTMHCGELYAGMAEVLEYWKQRALEAERTTERLLQLNSSPIFMGEPLLEERIDGIPAPVVAMAERLSSYMAMHHPGHWKLSGVQSRDFTAPAPAAAPAVDDPWRGLYKPERMPTLDALDGYCAHHPDLPEWPDDEERSIIPLLEAQGFEIKAMPGEYGEDWGREDFDPCAWLASWTPEPPASGKWRLAGIADSEDGPVSLWVRPLAALIESKDALLEEYRGMIKNLREAGELLQVESDTPQGGDCEWAELREARSRMRRAVEASAGIAP